MWEIRTLFRQAFWQLFPIYLILVTLASLRVFTRYTLHFEIFALIIAVIFALREEKPRQNVTLPKWLLLVALMLILVLRFIPYWTSDIPIGYDASFYTAAIDQYAELHVEEWFATWSPPGLFTVTNMFKSIGVSTRTLVLYFYIILQIFLGAAIYVFTKTLFDRNSAILATFIYGLSYAQFIVFRAMFFKNVLALILLLTALTFVWRKQYVLGSITAIALCGIHQPTFLVFGLVYGLYAINVFLTKDRKLIITHFVSGALILALGLLYYVKEFATLIGNQVTAFTTGVGPGAFIDLFKYEFSSLGYLPLALMGFFMLVRNRKFNMVFTWFVISATIVYFKLVFYNRFVVFLDIMSIVLAGYALSMLFCEHKKTTILLSVLIFISMASIVIPAAMNTSPHILPEELAFIRSIPEHTEKNASIISNMVEDAPLLEAYSNRTIIAPGLFGHGNWTLTQWTRYWTADSFEHITDLMNQYPRPLYIYLGEKTQRGDTGKFNNSCVAIIDKEDRMELLRYDC